MSRRILLIGAATLGVLIASRMVDRLHEAGHLVVNVCSDESPYIDMSLLRPSEVLQPEPDDTTLHTPRRTPHWRDGVWIPFLRSQFWLVRWPRSYGER